MRVPIARGRIGQRWVGTPATEAPEPPDPPDPPEPPAEDNVIVVDTAAGSVVPVPPSTDNNTIVLEA